MIRRTATTVFLAGIVCLIALHHGTASPLPGTLTLEDIAEVNTPFTGDFDQMVKDRVIRVLMPYSKTFFFFDGAQPRGLSYDAVMEFEAFVNKKIKTGARKIDVVVIPTARENLFSKLNKGLGDLAVGNLTITEERLAEVDFSNPLGTGVDEVLVSAKKGREFDSVFELAGKKIHVRKSSSYYESLVKLNDTLRAVKKPEVEIVLADEHLEDEDLLEMVNANLIDYMIIDNHKGEFWVKILDNIMLHPNIKVRSDGKIGWAMRKDNPELKNIVNEFIKDHKIGTLTGNMLFNKYLKNTKYITDSHVNEHLNRFKLTIGIFKKYGKQYNFDALMLAAMGYQESKLNQELKSSAGAVGVMQVLPSTAKDKNVGIPDIYELDQNIHAGTKYLRFMTDRYFAGDENLDPLNRTLFTFASYNAGPAKVARMRKDAGKMGLDPDVWFGNVEVVAAKQIGRETVQYVSNIFKYYVSYKMLQDKLPMSGPVHLSGKPGKIKKSRK